MTDRTLVRRTTRAAAWSLSALGLGLAAQAAAIPAKAVIAQTLLARAFERGNASLPTASALPWTDTRPVARIAVPRLGVRQIVLEGGSPQALALGPTVVVSRAAGSRSRVTVIAGHRDTHFRFIRELVLGDIVSIEAPGGRTTRYRVRAFETVRWDRFAVPTDPPRPLLALATCYPFEGRGGGPWRRVAWAEAAS
jgi:sortase A